MSKRLKNILMLLGFVLTLQSLFAQRQTYNFNSDWQFITGEIEGAEATSFDTEGWTKVTLPHAYNQEEAFLKAIDEHSTGIVWYRKNFILPEAAKGQKIFLEFEGIRQGGDIYVNGKQVGLHENGVMAFGLDLSDIVVFDGEPNNITLRIDNDWHYRQRSTNATYRWNNINFNANYGGIPKNVFLHITDNLYQTLPLYSNLETTGVYVYATAFDISQASATVHVESEVKNEYDSSKTFQYSVAVFDLDNKKVAEFSGAETSLKPGERTIVSAAQRLNDLHFWSWGYGYLYTVKSMLKVDGNVIDEVSTKTGFRKTEFKEGKVYLNDRVLQMKGYAQRTSNEWPAIGMSVPAWLSDFSNRMIVEGNGNLVRWMHVTPWKQDIESCDRVGLLQAMPAGDAEKDSQGDHWKQRTNLMRDAIIYSRNNPSIVFYESGNESISEAHMAEMKSLRDTYDPYGGRAIGSREMLDSREAEYGGEMLYINK
ncbi:MAG TPA: beta-galactosidase, partial [Leeuwenhoekiella sp.]|nr:beta-galactosidase [Leeuwenhoekiella sp.]